MNCKFCECIWCFCIQVTFVLHILSTCLDMLFYFSILFYGYTARQEYVSILNTYFILFSSEYGGTLATDRQSVHWNPFFFFRLFSRNTADPWNAGLGATSTPCSYPMTQLRCWTLHLLMALVAAWDQLSSFSVHSFFLFCLYEDAECDFENSLNTAVAHFAIVSVFFFF